jgi:hypothetical protein
MPQPAPGKEVGIVPSAVVTVTLVGNVLTPSQDPTNINAGGAVQFNNNTTEGVAVELFTKQNDHRVEMSLYIAPGGSVVVCNDPNSPNTKCWYNLVVYPPTSKITAGTSGGHSIVISSSMP